MTDLNVFVFMGYAAAFVFIALGCLVLAMVVDIIKSWWKK